VTRAVFNTDVDSGVSELSWVDVEVTCDVCSVVHLSHTESRSVFDGAVAVIDSYAVVSVTVICCTQRVEPRNKITPTDVAATLHGHLRVLLDRCILWCTNQCGLHHCVHISTHKNDPQ